MKHLSTGLLLGVWLSATAQGLQIDYIAQTQVDRAVGYSNIDEADGLTFDPGSPY